MLLCRSLWYCVDDIRVSDVDLSRCRWWFNERWPLAVCHTLKAELCSPDISNCCRYFSWFFPEWSAEFSSPVRAVLALTLPSAAQTSSNSVCKSMGVTAAAAPLPFRPGDPAVCGSHPLVTHISVDYRGFAVFCVYCLIIVCLICLCTICTFSTLILLVGFFDL